MGCSGICSFVVRDTCANLFCLFPLAVWQVVFSLGLLAAHLVSVLAQSTVWSAHSCGFVSAVSSQCGQLWPKPPTASYASYYLVTTSVYSVSSLFRSHTGAAHSYHLGGTRTVRHRARVQRLNEARIVAGLSVSSFRVVLPRRACSLSHFCNNSE